MPKPPKSPLEKPSNSGHSRRPSGTKRTSSDKSVKESSSSKHHGLTGPKSPSLTSKAFAKMSDASSSSLGSKLNGNDDTQFGARRGSKDVETVVQEVADNEQGLYEGELKSSGAEPRDAVFDSTSGNPSDEIDRLRDAVNARLILNQKREKLPQNAGGISKSGGERPSLPGRNSRVSPIHEETIMSPSLNAAFASPLPTGLETASTESARTVRGGNTPAAFAVHTPSYPFPSMKPPRQLSYTGHRPFTALSPTVAPAAFSTPYEGPRERTTSGSVTPASTMNFQPPGSYPSEEDPNYPSPNLYELSLLLTSEPGLDAWWNTVSHVMREIFRADRVTLSVPADSTDVENVPWGQKATFNVTKEDELSLAYLPRGSSLIPSSSGGTNDSETMSQSPRDQVFSSETTRPGLSSRHSFAAYEDTKRETMEQFPESGKSTIQKPLFQRSKSYVTGRTEQPPRFATLKNAELSLQALEEHSFEEAEKTPWDQTNKDNKDAQGRVFSVLQALDYESDPLIDSSGVIRVLDRGNVIALTRDYPYLQTQDNDASNTTRSSKAKSKSKESESKSKRSKPEAGRKVSYLGLSRPRHSRTGSQASRSVKGAAGSDPHEDEVPDQTARYEEYEQTPPSPWSQSPAPSPAIRGDANENPFFTGTTIEEESFNPATLTQDYSNMRSIEAIGIDRSCTVLHIPLTHPVLSKPVHSFRLNTAALELKGVGKGKGKGEQIKTDASPPLRPHEQLKQKSTPIAILSIISSITPYPSSLRHALQNLAPHLATSFSLCRHASNLETEISGLSRRRPHISGFGAIAHRPTARDRHPASSPSENDVPARSVGDSFTSPSDYSGVSRSCAASPSGTPNWDPSVLGFSRERTSASDSPQHSITQPLGDSYFTTKSRPSLGRETSPVTGGIVAKELGTSPLERRETKVILKTDLPDEPSQARQTRPGITTRPTAGIDENDPRDTSPSRMLYDNPLSPRRQAMRGASTHGTITKAHGREHTQLHSYGADFGSTFQSLPNTTADHTKPILTTSSHGPPGAPSEIVVMPPPSDRLKTLMLDTLPAHLFVALPQTGEIVWVNNRYLTYRGQSVADLFEDPWSSIHPEEREEYLKAWGLCLRTGEQFSIQVRIRRFDGTYRWFFTRAVGGKDTRGVIVQWYGSFMDIHDQHIAEVKAARQEEIEASESKHRMLANLIPQIIFSATEEEGITFANEQWLSYTGQAFDDALGIGFIDHVHPDDLAKCRIPTGRNPSPRKSGQKREQPTRTDSQTSSGISSGISSGDQSSSTSTQSAQSDAPTEATLRGMHQTLSRNNSSSSESMYELPSADLSELARSGVIKIETDANGRLSYTTEVRLKSKTGEYRWHLVRCVEVDNINFGSGEGSWFGACTDINDHKLLETKLKEAMDSKTRFLSNMSHEIRTPLIGISGMVSFLQDTPLTEEQADFANTIQTSASSLLMIINDILDLSKVDAGMMKLSYEWFHTRSLIEDVNELVSTMAISKRLELNYVVDEDVPPMVKGDKVRIRQVLLNVIGNAIKFTSEGEVFSHCTVFHDKSADSSSNEIMLQYSVVDTGAGFTKEEAELIFKPFSQIDGSSTRQHGGSGLGLVISRQLVELHGGKMEGTAVPGQGSTFTFTVKLGLPTDSDHPESPATALPGRTASSRSSVSVEVSARALKSAGGNPALVQKMLQSPPTMSPRSDLGIDSPAIMSSASSDPSIRSVHTYYTARSSASSVNPGLSHFSEAAKASSTDVTTMNLAIPERSISPGTTPTGIPVSRKTSSSDSTMSDLKSFRPPMYSILIICPQTHSREATTKHIETTLPKDAPHQITALASVDEARKLIGGNDPVIFTHIVLNLNGTDEIIQLMDQILGTASLPHIAIVILSDPIQRQAVIKTAKEYDYDQLAKYNRVVFVYKPVKPSRFAAIFDPEKERDLSFDRNRSSAQQQVASQKQNYLDVEKRLGNKGHKVLLIEDNLVNQKVLLKYLSKVGIAVETALDGVEGTAKVFSNPHDFYSIILCDLHMPHKDGYETCLDIRKWEKFHGYSSMPIIALSANVMADVLERCVEAGFNSYVTKPIDFKALSTAMSDLLDPVNLGKAPALMRIAS